jgi:hypothetical protein
MKSLLNCYCQKKEARYNGDDRTHESEDSDARSFEYGIVLGYRARSALHASRPFVRIKVPRTTLHKPKAPYKDTPIDLTLSISV